MVSPLHSDGSPRSEATRTCLDQARHKKETKYKELDNTGTSKLVVLACEVGGRWHDEAQGFVDTLASKTGIANPGTRVTNVMVLMMLAEHRGEKPGH